MLTCQVNVTLDICKYVRVNLLFKMVTLILRVQCRYISKLIYLNSWQLPFLEVKNGIRNMPRDIYRVR